MRRLTTWRTVSNLSQLVRMSFRAAVVVVGKAGAAFFPGQVQGPLCEKLVIVIAGVGGIGSGRRVGTMHLVPSRDAFRQPHVAL